MIKRTLGAPLGGTMRGGHHTFESLTLSLSTPPNFGGGAGSWSPLSVMVALGEPRTPVTCCAAAGSAAPNRNAAPAQTTAPGRDHLMRLLPSAGLESGEAPPSVRRVK